MAFNQAYIITENNLKKYYAGYIDPNIDANLLMTFILEAQNVNLQDAIGYNMWNFVITNLATGVTMSNQYNYLIENFLQPSVAYWSIWNALPFLHSRITNKSVVVKNSDYSQPVQDNTIDKLLQTIENKARKADKAIYEYISNYPSDFQEYYQISGANHQAPSAPYEVGLYLAPYRANQEGRPCTNCPGGFNEFSTTSIWGT